MLPVRCPPLLMLTTRAPGVSRIRSINRPVRAKCPQVVGAELALEAIFGLAVRDHHDPRVVDQQIQTVVLGFEGSGERTDRIC